MKTIFTRNLFLTMLFLIGVTSSKAQFMCTDIVPDSVVAIPTGTTNQIDVNIDLNNDNTPDFRITSAQSGALGFVNAMSNQVGLNNFVLDDGANNGLALTLGTPINGTCTTWHAMNTNNVIMAAWNASTAVLGNFPIAQDRYLGLKLIVGTNTYYGWARFVFSTTVNTYTLKEYGYNATPNASIPAGQTCAACTFTPQFNMITTGLLCPGATVAAAKGNTVVANTYTWSSSPSGPVFSAPNGSVTNITFANAGTYTITLAATDGSSCTANYSKTITINPSPTVTVVSSASVVLCSGQTATLTANGGATYNFGSGFSTTSTLAVSPTVTTNYTVTAMNSFSCTKTTVFTQSVTICSGIAQMTLNNEQYLVYPNPASDKIYITSKSNTVSLVNVEVMDAYGKVVLKHTQRFESSNSVCLLPLEQLSAGMYFIKLSSNGGKSEIIRIIKN